MNIQEINYEELMSYLKNKHINSMNIISYIRSHIRSQNGIRLDDTICGQIARVVFALDSDLCRVACKRTKLIYPYRKEL
jgi:hypothetical protein